MTRAAKFPGLHVLAITVAFCIPGIARAGDVVDELVRDRVAVERIYYNHRLGTKPPFDEIMPRSFVERLVQEDVHKEAVLKKIYGVEITPAMLASEVHRIDTTTRAPEVLAELKAALGGDTNRFARTVAEPIVVERILRGKFENDDRLHAAQRQQAGKIRTSLLAARQDHAGPGPLQALFKQLGSNQVSDTTWQLGKPPTTTQAGDEELMEARRRFGPNAQILSSRTETGGAPEFYFDDLPPELQRVLNVQLRRPGDISAVIETPVGFQLYLCKERTPTALSVSVVSILKRSYEQWLAE